MERVLKQTAIIRFLLALMLVANCSTVQALADDSRARVTRAEYTDAIIYIYYDLSGSPEEVYAVSLSVTKRSDPSYHFVPKYVSGDVGPSMFPGIGWRIAWSVKRDLPEGVNQKDIVFVVEAKPVGGSSASSGSNTLLWVAGGAAAVGGIVAVILSKGKSGGGSTGGGSAAPAFPIPPGRP